MDCHWRNQEKLKIHFVGAGVARDRFVFVRGVLVAGNARSY
jgi:hypothetical protein